MSREAQGSSVCKMAGAGFAEERWPMWTPKDGLAQLDQSGEHWSLGTGKIVQT